MADDDDLFGYSHYDGDPPSQKHSDTSRAAAAQIKKAIGPLHIEIIQFLTANPYGATDEQMQVEIPMTANTQRPRRVELVEAGRVMDSGRRRPTRSNREAVIWVLKARAPPPEPACRHCNEVGGVFSRATYAGALDGGVLVHTRCLTAFYAALDKRPYRY